MRYRTHGTRLAALLLVAIMALSVFAMPVAAGVTDDTITVTADEVTDGDKITAEDVTLEIDETVDEDDEVVLTMNKGPATEGDFNIADVEVNSTEGDLRDTEDIDVDLSTTVFKTYDDTITLSNLVDDEVDVEQDDLDLEITIEVQDDLTDRAADFNADGLIDVESDDTDIGLSGDVVNLDIVPDQADSAVISDGPSNMTFDDSQSVEIEIEDQYNNVLEDESVDGELDDVVEDVIDYDPFTVEVDISNDNADVGTEEEEVDFDGDQEEISFDINEGEDFDDLIAGYFTLEVGEEGESADDSTLFDIYVDEIATELDDDEISAVDDETTLTVDLSEGDIENEDDFDEANVRIKGLEESVNITDVAEGVEGVEYVQVPVTEIETELTLTSDDAGDYEDIEIVHLDRDNEATDPSVEHEVDTLNVNPGAPHEFHVDEEDGFEVAYEDSFDQSIDVNVIDEKGNLIEDTFGTTETRVTLQGEHETEIIEFEHDGQTDDFTLENKPGEPDDEIQAHVGTFDVTVEQIGDDELEDGELNDLRIYPGLNIESQWSDTNAGEDTDLDLELTATNDAETLITDIDGDGEIDSVDVAFAVQSGDDDTELQAGNDDGSFTAHIDGETVTNASADDRSADITTTSDDIYVTLNSQTAGEFAFDDADVMPLVEHGDTQDNVENTKVHAQDVHSVELDINDDLDEIVGTVTNDEIDYTFDVLATDEYDNFVNYDGDNDEFERLDIEITLEEQNIQSFTEKGDFTGDVTKADGEIEVTLDSTTFNNDDLGETEIVALNYSGDQIQDESEDLTLVHEAFDLDEDFQRLSIPQPAEVVDNGVNHATTWNTSEQTYDSDELDLEGVIDDSTTLGSGLYVNGEDDEARIGFDFQTDEETEAEPGTETLEDGWNFIGTNFDISNADNIPTSLEEDLLSVSAIENDPSAPEFVMDGDLSNLLSADDDNDGNTTEELHDAITVNEDNDGEYGTYWVYVEDVDRTDFDETRQVVGPTYDTETRSDAIDSSE